LLCLQVIDLFSQAPVAHACDPSYSGGRDQEHWGMKPVRANSLQDLTSKTLNEWIYWINIYVQTYNFPFDCHNSLLSLCLLMFKLSSTWSVGISIPLNIKCSLQHFSTMI
jgi:hypothetical protein